MHRRFLTIILMMVYVASFSQALKLRPSITKAAYPQDNTPIKTPPIVISDMVVSGYQIGDTIPDFTLYSFSGRKVTISEVLQENKPLLLVSGSYTCPNFRNYMDTINDMVDFYKNFINVYIVYTVEAHPDKDTNLYTNTICVKPENEEAHIAFRQPKTYSARKDIVRTMKKKMKVAPEVLIDSPDNEWWLHFGLAPNKAYLVNSDGVIVGKCGPWFRDAKCNLWCKIDKMLHIRSGRCER